MQDDHGDAERRHEDPSIDAREGAVCREKCERRAREGCREEERAGQGDAKRDEDRTHPSDAEGDERRATEKCAGSRPWESREVRRQTGRDVLDLQPRDEEGEKKVETPTRRAAPRRPVKKVSAPRMIKAMPAASRTSEARPDGMRQVVPPSDRDALRVIGAERERAEVGDPPRFPRVVDGPDHGAQTGIAEASERSLRCMRP